jgi:ABC-type antimicrobial peptide transport system permease subunit
MNFAVLNLKHSLKKEKAITALILICSFAASFMLLFALGAITHFQKQNEYGDTESYELSVVYTDLMRAKQEQNPQYAEYAQSYDGYLSFGDLKKLKSMLDNSVMERCNNIYSGVLFKTEHNDITVQFASTGGMFATGMTLISLRYMYDSSTNLFYMNEKDSLDSGAMSYRDQPISGRHINQGDYLEQHRNAAIGIGIFNDLYTEKKYETECGYNTSVDSSFDYGGNYTIELFGEQYQVVGVLNGTDIEIPVSALPDEARLISIMPDALTLQYDFPVTHLQYTYLQEALEKAYAGRLSVKPIEFEHHNRTFYLLMIALIVGISLISSVIIAIMMHYIFSKRKQQIAIFKIFGAANHHINRYLFAECGMMILPAFFAGAVVYLLAVKNKITDIYIYSFHAYTPQNIVWMLLCYLAILYICLFFVIHRIQKIQPVDLRRKN